MIRMTSFLALAALLGTAPIQARAQSAPAANPEFAGTVAHVATSEYWDHVAQDILDRGWINRVWVDEELKAQFDRMGNQPPYHYLGSGKIMSLVGFGCGESMLGLLSE